ncbi:MAG TPA: serine/threonine-protein kinase [Ilumatobacteraceae bacterium]|nr:serine/threonine-protein kinase [Ilumatobacteraceae bacterium]
MQERLAGRYVLGAELGRGGMARVVVARDLRLHRQVAVKLLPVPAAEPSEARQRFVREARAAAAFNHPHAVAIFDAGVADDVLFIVMELVDGETVATRVGRRGPLDVAESLRIVDEVLQALAAAHRAGIVHRDVKPGNVLLTADGTAKLADFGIAKRLDDGAADVTIAGHVIGTPSYLAPEQLAGGRVTPAVDIYAAGVLLFEMLTGRKPYVGNNAVEIALARRASGPADVRELRADVDFGALYGPQWAHLADTEPSHVTLARGSAVRVLPPQRGDRPLIRRRIATDGG